MHQIIRIGRDVHAGEALQYVCLRARGSPLPPRRGEHIHFLGVRLVQALISLILRWRTQRPCVMSIPLSLR